MRGYFQSCVHVLGKLSLKIFQGLETSYEGMLKNKTWQSSSSSSSAAKRLISKEAQMLIDMALLQFFSSSPRSTNTQEMPTQKQTRDWDCICTSNRSIIWSTDIDTVAVHRLGRHFADTDTTSLILSIQYKTLFNKLLILA